MHVRRLGICIGIAISMAIAIDYAGGVEPLPSETNLSLNSMQERVSYGVGLTIGRDLAADGISVSLRHFVAGVVDALQGAPSRLNEQQLKECLDQLTQELETRRRQIFEAESAKNRQEGAAFQAANAKKLGVKQLAGGLQYQVLKAGSGGSPQATDRVVVHYHGTLINGTVFDSSVQRGEPTEIDLKDGIEGWTQAVTQMKEGDKWRLVVPPALAFGDQSVPPHIGPEATLIFEIELVRIVR